MLNINSKAISIIASIIVLFSYSFSVSILKAAPTSPVIKVSDNKKINGVPNPINKVGNPYEINGIKYKPQVQPNYDSVGIASWYGDDFHGNITSNGEVFDKQELTAAHATLPMPSFVEVTNLENGNKIVVRVNDRGPFKSGRIIDLSERAAELLGFKNKGTAKVRVKVLDVNANAQAKNSSTISKANNQATANVQNAIDCPVVEISNSSDNDLQIVNNKNNNQNKSFTEPSNATNYNNMKVVSLQEPTGVKTYVPRGVFVQIGAFNSENEKIKKDMVALSDMGVVSLQKVDLNGKAMLRLRVGPYGSIDDAVNIKNKLIKLGYSQSRVIIEQ
jgi:rare lipoprotein A